MPASLTLSWPLHGLAILIVLLGLAGCDRNSAPPQRPQLHVIEVTREGGDAPEAQASGDRADRPGAVMPYGAAAPMAPGSDGVRRGLDQAPVSLQAPEAIVDAWPTGAGVVQHAVPASPDIGLSATELTFLTQAAEISLFEQRVGAMGLERARDSAVRSYAAMLVADQATLLSGLQQLAQQLRIPLPETLSEPRLRLIQQLAYVPEQAFDQQFVRTVGVRDRAAMLALFERTGRHTRHHAVRAFVFEALPMLRAHMAVAQQLPVAALQPG